MTTEGWMGDGRDAVAAWVGREILPHEPAVRAALAHRWRGAIDVDDVIQEAYCRIAALASVAHIESPIAYFRRTTHAAAVDAVRRTSKENIVWMTEGAWNDVWNDEPPADRVVAARQELRRVRSLLAQLSGTCRRVIELRRVEGLSQRETAERLGVSENVVENHIARGLKRVMKALAEQDAAAEDGEVERIGERRLHG